MLRYKCLVFDHDDTVVQSSKTVNYPNFLDTLHTLQPGREFSLEQFMVYSADPGFQEMCVDCLGFSDEDLQYMFHSWQEYVKTHIPPGFDGMKEIIWRQKQEGGLVCVSSHSSPVNISRDWTENFGLLPDQIYGWELGKERRKPKPYALQQIMQTYQLAPSDLVMIDDLKPGYLMAKSCHVDFIAAGWSHTFAALRKIMQENCDFYLSDVAQLQNFLFA